LILRNDCEPLEPRRLFAAGDQDLSFGDNGLLHLRFGETPYQFLPGSDPTGTAFVVSMNANGQSFDIRKFMNGVPDTTAGRKGSIITIPVPFTAPAGSTTKVGRVWQQSGGRLVVEFTTRNRTIVNGDLWPDGHYTRLNADFTLDTTYGSNGWRDVPFRLSLLTAQQGDALVAIERNKVTRYTPEGAFDTTFGSGGAVLLNGLNDNSQARIAVQADGKIVVAGTKVTTSLYRLNPDGTPDTTFGGGDGHVEVPNIADNKVGLAIDGSGNIIVTGNKGAARFTPAGAVDPSYGGTGFIVPTQDCRRHAAVRPARRADHRRPAQRVHAPECGRQPRKQTSGIVATDLSIAGATGLDNYSRMLETIHPNADGSVQIWRRDDDGRLHRSAHPGKRQRPQLGQLQRRHRIGDLARPATTTSCSTSASASCSTASAVRLRRALVTGHRA
jgi:uncharacterized delta-60 repeat protein